MTFMTKGGKSCRQWSNRPEIRSQPRLLLVGDKPTDLAALTRTLSGLDIETMTATDGHEALRHVSSQTFAMLLLGGDRQDRDDFEMARRFKELQSTRDLPIVLITDAPRDARRRHLDSPTGGIDWIEKPIDENELLGKMRVYLQLFRQKVEIIQLRQDLNVRTKAHRETEERLQASEERFRGLVEHFPGMIYRCRMDRTMLFISDMIETMTGYPASDFIDNRIRSYASIIHADDVEHVEEVILFGVDKKEPFEIEYRIVDAKGKIRWVYEKGQRVTYDNGQPDWLDGAIFDNSARRMAEEEHAKFQRAVEQSPVSVVMTDPEGNIQYVNPWFCRITGYSFEEAVGKNPRFLKSGQTDPELHQKLWQTITSGKVWQGELLNRKKDGTFYWELASISPVYTDPKGPVTHFIGVKEDITARKEVEKALQDARKKAEEASRAKSEFLATMSHEIRTPMNAIIGMADQLAEMELEPRGQRYLEVIRRNGENLLIIINDILDFSKIEAGRMPLEEKPFDLKQLLVNLMEECQYRAQKKGLTLTWVMDEEIVMARKGDPHRLWQVLENLLGNALKFTHTGEICLTIQGVSTPNDQVRFSLSDTGIGIAKDKLEAVFSAFTQADSSITREYGGTGLGLAVCKRLAEKMGGGIAVESELGTGSTFHLTIPLQIVSPDSRREFDLVADTRLGAQELTRKRPPSPLPSLQILLAEDVEDNIFLIQSFLEGTPHQLEVVRNGRLALEEVKTRNFDLVLMDIRMPVMDGLEASRKIRQWEKGAGRPRLAIWALTAHAHEGEAKQSREAGCDLHLVKPLRKKVLMERLAGFITTAEATIQPSTTREVKIDLPDEIADVENIIDPRRWECLKRDMGVNVPRLVGRFISRLPNRLAAIAEAVHEGNADSLDNECHKLKGAAATLGAGNLVSLCMRMNAFISTGDMRSVQENQELLIAECQRTVSVLEQKLADERK
ncbi:MAG: PAS domain S-box protein [Magnetococcales bacterium]|nr:PAS domain S-box protein [Magnetococcales bacterium]